MVFFVLVFWNVVLIVYNIRQGNPKWLIAASVLTIVFCLFGVFL